MPPVLSSETKTSLNAENLADEIATLVTIEDEDTLDEPLRYTTSAKTRLSVDPLEYGLVSLGQTFKHALRNAMLPDENEDNAQGTEIVIDNIVEDAAPAIRTLSPDATVSIALALANYPDTRFAETSGFKIINRVYDMETITIDVSRHGLGENDLLEPMVGERQTRQNAPGLHR